MKNLFLAFVCAIFGCLSALGLEAAHGQTLTGSGLVITRDGSTLSGDAFLDVTGNNPTTGQFNIGWLNSYFREGYQLSQGTSAEGHFTGCSVTAAAANAEYDCGWFLATAFSTGNGSTGAAAVGLRDDGNIPASNPNGAAWGGIDYAGIGAPGDGQLIGREIDVTNNGTDVVNPQGGGKVKIGQQMVMNGTAAGSAYINMLGQAHYGIYTTNAALVAGGYFAFVDDGSGSPVFAVQQNGKVYGEGYITRTGYNGAYTGHVFNLQWTGSALHIYIDNTDLGAVTFH